MKKLLFTIFIFFSLFLGHSQSSNYNTYKGFGVKGYDVVAYFDNEAVKGHERYSITYKEVVYKFSSQAHLMRFKSQPERFLPQYGGYCAYAVALKSEKVDINPKAFEIRDGKLYLFYNAWGSNTLKLWQKNNVKGLQHKADQNWEAMILE
ncbi:YHS domain-containing (seleno)protein [Psychroserpens sp. BH13MA-6]